MCFLIRKMNVLNTDNGIIFSIPLMKTNKQQLNDK